MNIQLSKTTTNLVECLQGLNNLNEALYSAVASMYGFKDEKTGEIKDQIEEASYFRELTEI